MAGTTATDNNMADEDVARVPADGFSSARARAEDRLLLAHGRSVAVRAAAPADAARIARLFADLSPESRALRFGAARGGLSDAEAQAMAAAPGPSGGGLVALAGGDDEHIVGLARYERTPGASEAEVAVAVDDRWQGCGVGTGLIERLLARAREDGLDALWAMCLPRNLRMRNVFRDLGAQVRMSPQPDEVLVRIPTGADEALEEAEIARFAASAAASLEPLFRPRSIAVVGASRDPLSPGGAIFRTLLEGEFPGHVYAVNSSAGEVAGVRAYPALALLPAPVDLVVVAVPAPWVPAVARQAAACGASALVVVSSGFAEAGPEGAALEAELTHIARTTGMRVLGPNCLGLAVSDRHRPFDATFAPCPVPAGQLAFASQSGGMGIGALSFCAARQIGLSAFVSLGNKADISSNDLLAWWERDPQTRAILLYLEGFGNPRRFARLARRVARTTPIVALKAGRGASGARAAGSHTAALAAGETATDALFEAAGVVRAQTVQELFEVGQTVADQPLPAGRRVAILTNAGGPGIVAADACEAAGLQVPRLDEALRDRLAQAVPAAAGTTNPVDLGAGAGAGAFAAAGGEILESGAVDALLVIYTPVHGGDPATVAKAVQELSDGRLTVVGSLLGRSAPPAPPDARWKVPWLGFPEDAARALAQAARAGEAARRPADPPPALVGVDRAAGRDALLATPPGAWLDAPALERLLAAYGLPFAVWRLVHSAEEAAAAQAAMGRPVAVKLQSRVAVHKSDVGGVVLGCVTPEAAGAAYREIEARAGALLGPEAMEGALVQEMAGDGPELLVGATADPLFGPLVLAGIGGVQAELWRDSALALAPVGELTARDMWSRLRGARLLDGWRGSPAADREALVDIVVRVARLAADQPLLTELDLNPVRALGPGRGALILDARARRCDA